MSCHDIANKRSLLGSVAPASSNITSSQGAADHTGGAFTKPVPTTTEKGKSVAFEGEVLWFGHVPVTISGHGRGTFAGGSVGGSVGSSAISDENRGQLVQNVGGFDHRRQDEAQSGGGDGATW